MMGLHTFNIFGVGFSLLPFAEKRIIHFVFPFFLLLSFYVGYLIVGTYHLSVSTEIIFFFSCFVPGCLVYVYSLVFIKKIDKGSTQSNKYEIRRLAILRRYALAKFFNSLWLPFIVIYLYLWRKTPAQNRKKKLRKAGWDVDNPLLVGKHMILHRKKNQAYVCSVTSSWKQIPIYETRSLGLLSQESQKIIEDILEFLTLELNKKFEKNALLLNEKFIIMGKRTYSPIDMLSRIKRKTPLGLSFLLKDLKEISAK